MCHRNGQGTNKGNLYERITYRTYMYSEPREPDLLIVFNAVSMTYIESNGYIICEQGSPRLRIGYGL